MYFLQQINNFGYDDGMDIFNIAVSESKETLEKLIEDIKIEYKNKKNGLEILNKNHNEKWNGLRENIHLQSKEERLEWNKIHLNFCNTFELLLKYNLDNGFYENSVFEITEINLI